VDGIEDHLAEVVKERREGKPKEARKKLDEFREDARRAARGRGDRRLARGGAVGAGHHRPDATATVPHLRSTRRLHAVSMPNVLVRDLPDDVHAELQRRAEARGQSLQQYLAGELTRLTGTPPMEELLDRIARRRGGRVGLRQAVQDVDAEWGGR
jgi:hypothetical protein